MPYQRILDFAPMNLPVPWRVERLKQEGSAQLMGIPMIHIADYVRLMIQYTWSGGWLHDCDVLHLQKRRQPRAFTKPPPAGKGTLCLRRGINLNEINRLVWSIEKGASCWDCSILNYWILWIYPATRTPTFFLGNRESLYTPSFGTEHPGWGVHRMYTVFLFAK